MRAEGSRVRLARGELLSRAGNLDADTAAVAGREIYDDAYFAAFFGRVKPILERRLADSITAVASSIASAWEQAGRPALSLDYARPPRKVRRQ